MSAALDLDDHSVVSTVRVALHDFYAAHNPGKAGGVGSVMAVWRGKEGALLDALEEKYCCSFFDEKWPALRPLLARRGGGEEAGRAGSVERVHRMFARYCPQRAGEAEAMLQAHNGRARALLATLVRCWGPEPPPEPDPPSPTAAATARVALERFCVEHAPTRLPRVPEMLRLWRGREEELLRMLQAEAAPPPDDVYADVDVVVVDAGQGKSQRKALRAERDRVVSLEQEVHALRRQLAAAKAQPQAEIAAVEVRRAAAPPLRVNGTPRPTPPPPPSAHPPLRHDPQPDPLRDDALPPPPPHHTLLPQAADPFRSDSLPPPPPPHHTLRHDSLPPPAQQPVRWDPPPPAHAAGEPTPPPSPAAADPKVGQARGELARRIFSQLMREYSLTPTRRRRPEDPPSPPPALPSPPSPDGLAAVAAAIAAAGPSTASATTAARPSPRGRPYTPPPQTRSRPAPSVLTESSGPPAAARPERVLTESSGPPPAARPERAVLAEPEQAAWMCVTPSRWHNVRDRPSKLAARVSRLTPGTLVVVSEVAGDDEGGLWARVADGWSLAADGGGQTYLQPLSGAPAAGVVDEASSLSVADSA